MKNNRKAQNSDYFDTYDATGSENSSRLSGVVFFVLCTILVVSTVAYGGVDTWAVALLTILIGLIALLWLADAAVHRAFRFNSNVLQLPIVGLIAVGLIQLMPMGNANISGDLLSLPVSNTLSIDPFATRFSIIQLCLYLIFFAALLTVIENEKRQRKLVFTIVLFGSLMAFFGVIQSLTNTNPNSILGMRENPGAFPFATFINRHHFAAFMNLTIGLTLGLLYGNSTKPDKRLLLLISLVLMGIALMFTGSRGGILSLFGVVAFVILANLFSRKIERNGEEGASSGFQRNLLLVASGLAIVLMLIGSAIFFGGESNVTRGLGLNAQTDISSGRLHYWQVAWQIFLHNPILGTGLDSFSLSYPLFDTWNGQQRVEQAHNDYLQILADAGILGFICVAAFIFFLYKKGLQTINNTDDRFRRGTAIGALGGIFGILVHSFFDFPLRTPSNAFFFLTLATLATATAIVMPAKHHRKRVRKTASRSVEEAA